MVAARHSADARQESTMTLPADIFGRMTTRDRLYLLAHDSDGDPLTHLPSIRLGLAAATICDLILSEHLTVQKGQISYRAGASVADPINAVVLGAVHASKPPRDLRRWLKWISGDIHERTTSGLHACGQLVRTSKRRLLGPDRIAYRPRTPEVANYVCAPLYRALCGTNYIDTSTYVMAGLVHALQLQRVIGINLSNTQLLDQLYDLAIRAEPPVSETVQTLHQLIGETATAAHG
jgi:hypothetical protein